MKKAALVTGGGSGLGFSMASLLGKKGIVPILLGRTELKLEQAREFLEEAGIESRVFVVDIADSDGLDMVLESVIKEFGIEYLFNVAGKAYFGPIEENTAEVIQDILKSNLIGLMLITSKILKLFREKSTGTIVSVLSSSALVGREKESAYCAAKWGARGFLESLKTAVKGTNIRSLIAYPGGINTPFWDEIDGHGYDLSKFMHPDDVAKKIVDAALDNSSAYVAEISISR